MNRPAARPEAGFRFRAAGPSWERPFLRRLAELLECHPEGDALLLESVASGPPLLVPASPPVARAVVRAAEGLPGEIERVAPLPAAAPCRRGPGAFVLLAPGAPPRPPIPVPAASRAPAADREIADLVPREPTGGVEAREPPTQWHWFGTSGAGLAVRARIAVPSPPSTDARSWAADLIGRFPRELGPVVTSLRRGGVRERADWSTGAIGRLWAGRPFALTPDQAAAAIRPPHSDGPLDEATLARHLVAIGASGSGKTTFLAELARRRIRAGRAVLLLDVHGDLGPAVVAGLSVAERASVVALDAVRPGRSPGIPAFSDAGPEVRQREVAHLVASLRHLSSDGPDRFWGPRLEQVFDVFVRLAEEERGGLRDLFELLADPGRREAARATTRHRVAARFLDELPALLRRQPDLLLPAIARVQKVALHPGLSRLLDAGADGLDLGATLAGGRSVLVRIPAAEIGPSESRFAATLLLSRAYLSIASAGPTERLRVLAVLDEAQSLAPTLLEEILGEGRKFGFGAALATQYAGRLSDSARLAVEGAAGTHLLFQVPRAAAAAAGRWAGLSEAESARILPALPPGVALLDRTLDRGPRWLVRVPAGPGPDPDAWSGACGGAIDPDPGEDAADGWEADEAILLAACGAGPPARRTSPGALVADAARILPGIDATALAVRLPALVARGWLEPAGDGLGLTGAGERRLGVGAPTGATRESAEHRALVVEAFRIFARHGERLELPRQGRFDTRLPDALLRLLPPGLEGASPRTLLGALELRSASWAWRSFGGRDVHVEAEVTGADRPERVRRGLAKARDRGAAVVFVVADARRARRVREALARERAGLPDARVWTLRAAAAARQPKEPVVR